MLRAAANRSTIHFLGYDSTDLSIEDTWVDKKGHVRLVKLERDGDYNTICSKQIAKREKANRDHARWRKKFMKQARAH